MLNINFAVTRLREIQYPTTALDAAIQWACATECARKRLKAGADAGLLICAGERENRLYSPSIELLNKIQEACE